MQFVYARVLWENSWRVGGVQAMSDIEVEHFIWFSPNLLCKYQLWIVFGITTVKAKFTGAEVLKTGPIF